MALTQISTAGVKDDAVTAGKIPANAVGSSEIAANAVGSSELADNAVDTAAIQDDAVTDAKLANSINSAIAANTAKVQTTINNNADNRVITGSGTANTLNGESSVVIDSIGQVSVGGSTTAFDTTGSLNGLQGYYETDSGIATIGSYSSGGSTVLNFHTNSGGGASSERMRITSDGKVGINVDPPYQFSVEKSVANDWVSRIYNSSTSSGYGLLVRSDNNTSDQAAFSVYSAGQHRFQVNQSMATFKGGGSSQVVRIDSDGLKFGSDTAAANALDDYEEGQHTMASNTNLTLHSSYNVIDYTKIGNVVTCTMLLLVNAVSGSDIVTVTLPFNNKQTSNPRRCDAVGAVMHTGVNTGDTGLVAYLPMGTNILRFYKLSDDASWAILQNSDLAVNDEIYVTITYKT